MPTTKFDNKYNATAIRNQWQKLVTSPNFKPYEDRHLYIFALKLVGLTEIPVHAETPETYPDRFPKGPLYTWIHEGAGYRDKYSWSFTREGDPPKSNVFALPFDYYWIDISNYDYILNNSKDEYESIDRTNTEYLQEFLGSMYPVSTPHHDSPSCYDTHWPTNVHYRNILTKIGYAKFTLTAPSIYTDLSLKIITVNTPYVCKSSTVRDIHINETILPDTKYTIEFNTYIEHPLIKQNTRGKPWLGKYVYGDWEKISINGEEKYDITDIGIITYISHDTWVHKVKYQDNKYFVIEVIPIIGKQIEEIKQLQHNMEW